MALPEGRLFRPLVSNSAATTEPYDAQWSANSSSVVSKLRFMTNTFVGSTTLSSSGTRSRRALLLGLRRRRAAVDADADLAAAELELVELLDGIRRVGFRRVGHEAVA